MRGRRLVDVVGVVVLLAAGCIDAHGNRVTVQEWFDGLQARNQTDDRRTARATAPERPSSDNEERGEVVEAPARPATDDAAHVSTRRSLAAVHADVLLVNEESIRVSDVLEPLSGELERLAQEMPPGTYYARAAELVRMQIVELVAQHLIWRRASRFITDDTRPQLEKAVAKMEKERIGREFGGLETEYEKYLVRHGTSRSEVRQRLERSLVIDSYIRDRIWELVPSPRKSELWEYYRRNRREFERCERREMFLIDIPVRAFLRGRSFYAPMRQERDAARAKAREAAEAAAQALAEGAPFEDVARSYSHGPRRDEGGAWGAITKPGDPDVSPLQGRWSLVSRRLFEMAEGQVSGIIEDADAESFFILKVGRVEPGTTASFQEAQPKIAAALKQQRFIKMRAEFLQKELDDSMIGSLDDFVARVMESVPDPR